MKQPLPTGQSWIMLVVSQIQCFIYQQLRGNNVPHFVKNADLFHYHYVPSYKQFRRLMAMNVYLDHYRKLRAVIKEQNKVVVAYSGGVDSTLVLKAALDSLGTFNVLAAMLASPLVPAAEVEKATSLATSLGATVRVINVNQLEIEEIAANPPDRCFYCKQNMMQTLVDMAQSEGCQAVLEGSNASDLTDYRPGFKAVQSLEMVYSPLLKCGLNKAQIRTLARRLGLDNWDQPPQACLATRIPYGIRLSPEILSQVNAAENQIKNLGITCVRVRYHGELARIEIAPHELEEALNMDFLKQLSWEVKACGFTYVTLDTDGYPLDKSGQARLDSP